MEVTAKVLNVIVVHPRRNQAYKVLWGIIVKPPLYNELSVLFPKIKQIPDWTIVWEAQYLLLSHYMGAE